LDGNPVENDVLKEMADYKTKLSTKLNDENRKQEDFNLIWEMSLWYNKYSHSNKHGDPKENSTKTIKESPFPFNHIYLELEFLDNLLYEKMRTYTLFIVTFMGQIDIDKEIDNKTKLVEYFQNVGKDNSMILMLKDKKLMKMIAEIKQELDYGYKQFSYIQQDNHF